jgi:cell division protein DivIC
MKKLKDIWDSYRMTVIVSVFLVWITFFDSNNLISLMRLNRQIHNLEKEAEFYKAQIETAKRDREALITNPELLEKFAREKYYMKKNDEDVFLIIKKD